MDKLKILFQKIISSTKATIQLLQKESKKTTPTLTPCNPATTTTAPPTYNPLAPQTFYTHLNELDKLQKMTPRNSRLHVHVLRDLDLGMRIGKSMRKFLPSTIGESRTHVTRAVGPSCSNTNVFISRYRGLLDISRSLLGRRFANTD